MKNLRNNVQIVGRVGNDLEIKSFGKSKEMCKFSLAYTDLYRDNNGETIANTHWFYVTAWGNLARKVQSALIKGDEIAVLGKLTSNVYTDKDGITRNSIEINLEQFMITKESKHRAA